MTYAAAVRASKQGYHIKREIWETWLSVNERGDLTFLLGSRLARALGTSYSPTETDRGAKDWQTN